MSDSTLHDLLFGLAEGDEKSFEKLFNLYKQKVYAYAMHFTHSATASEEIVQNIFLKLWLKRKDFRQIDRFEAYLYTITRNLCFDHLKKLANEKAMKEKWSRIMETSDKSTESKMVYDHYQKLVRQALQILPPQQKEVYSLSFYQGRKPEEIAHNLHISRNTVKVHLSKARAAVRKYLAAHIEMVILLSMVIFHHF